MRTLFESLPVEIQADIKRTLRAYDKCNVYYEYGEYHVSTAYFLSAEYAPDFRTIGEFTAKELFTPEERMINYIESFHEYPIGYKGKRDYKMLNELDNEKSITLLDGTVSRYPNWDAKFAFDDNGNLVRIS